MKQFIGCGLVGALLAVAVALTGCNDKPAATGSGGTTGGLTASTGTSPNESDDVAVVRAKLSHDERALVEAQEWCVIMDDVQLGSMGPPIKLDIKGQTVFVCCKGCKRKAESNPDKTLAKLAELKEKAKTEKAGAGSPRR